METQCVCEGPEGVWRGVPAEAA